MLFHFHERQHSVVHTGRVVAHTVSIAVHTRVGRMSHHVKACWVFAEMNFSHGVARLLTGQNERDVH